MDTTEDPMDDDNLSIALDQLENLTLAQADARFVPTPGDYDETCVRVLVDIAHSLRKLSGRGI